VEYIQELITKIQMWSGA